MSRRRGHTLVELMVVVVVLGALFALAPRLTLHVTRFFRLSQAKSENLQDARAAVILMTRTLRQAKASSIAIPDGTSIRFRRTSPAGGGDQDIVYFKRGAELVQEVDGQQLVLTKNLKSLLFFPQTGADFSLITISLTMERSTYEGQSKEFHITTDRIKVENI